MGRGSENDATSRVGGNSWLGGAGGAAARLAGEDRELGGVLELAGAIDNDQHSVSGVGGLLAWGEVTGNGPLVGLLRSGKSLDDGGI